MYKKTRGYWPRYSGRVSASVLFYSLYHTMHEGRSLVPRPAQSSVARITGTKNGVLRATRKLRGPVNEAMRDV